ncbi:hypothetical protein HMPREF9413_3513 [Paenibacillus sp. HGF7]|nr:hypothetical protein HMPREF9413_3513 [Paenibacillus sp. HGF7]
MYKNNVDNIGDDDEPRRKNKPGGKAPVCPNSWTPYGREGRGRFEAGPKGP